LLNHKNLFGANTRCKLGKIEKKLTTLNALSVLFIPDALRLDQLYILYQKLLSNNK